MSAADRGTVGIPRTLFYYRYFPAWQRFFETLGVRVVLSGPTSRPTLDRGVELAVTDACVPIKIIHGHLAELAGRGVDRVFVPRIVCTNGRTVYCPKFLGLPDMVRGAVANLPEILTTRYDARRGSGELARAAQEIGTQLGASPAEIVRALVAARAEHSRLVRLSHSMGVPPATVWEVEQGLTSMPAPASADLRLAVVGYPYEVHDQYLNLNLLTRLTELGVQPLTADGLDRAVLDAHRAELTKDLFWTYSEEAVCAGYHFLSQAGRLADGVVHITAFGCGPDSVAGKLLALRAEELGNVPFLSLMIDEHTGEAGMRTRIEAFVDMVRRRRSPGLLPERPGSSAPVPRRSVAIAPDWPPAARRRRHARRRRKVTFPYMGTLPEVFSEVLEQMGNEVIKPERPSRQTLTLGTAHSPEFACLPFKILLGTYLEAIEAGADTVVSSGGIGPCRAGLYTMLQEKILAAAGRGVEVITLEPPGMDLPDFLRKVNALNAAGLPPWRVAAIWLLAWRKVKALDELERASNSTRAREVVRGQTSRLWRELQSSIYVAKSKEQVAAALVDGHRRLGEVPLKPGFEPLRVGIVGEIYVVVEPSSNLEIEEVLGHMGVETRRSIYMSGWTRESNLLGRPDQRRSHEAEHAAAPFLGEMIGGHGQESVGSAVLFWESGYDGVIQLAPFTCIPEIVAKSVLEQVQRELGLPVLSLWLDEQTGRAGLETRLEAFTDLLWRNRTRHTAAGSRRALPEAGPGGEAPRQAAFTEQGGLA